MAAALAARDVLYVPDFIANSGGIIHVGAEALGLERSEVERLIAASIERCEQILGEAAASGRLPLELAEEMAEARLCGGRERAAQASA